MSADDDERGRDRKRRAEGKDRDPPRKDRDPPRKDRDRPRAREAEEAPDERSDAPDERSGDAGAGAEKRAWTTDELVAALKARARKLKDGSPYVNEKLLKALGKRGAEAVAPLAALLEDERSPVRWAAAAALGRIALRHGDRTVREATPKLLTLAEDKNVHVRGRAIEALATLRSQRDAVLPALVRALGDGDARVSRAAVMHIMELGVEPAVLTERMVEVLTTKRAVYHRVGALMVLFHLGKAAKGAMPHLVEAIEDPSAEVREYANLALMGIRTPSMRLQIIRTASMRLRAVDEEPPKPVSSPSDDDPGPPSSDETRRPLAPRRRRRPR